MFRSIREWLKDPSGMHTCSTNLHNHISELKNHIFELRAEQTKSFDQILEDYKVYAKEKEEEAKFYHLSLHAIGDVLPDMIWMKWVDGKYAYANKAIRDNLLFDDKPIGKTDTEMGGKAASIWGSDLHNFGSYCAGSDTVTVEVGHRKRFIEYGMSGGRPLVLEVFKNVVRNEYGDIIATVGSGRDITDNIFTMLRLEETGSCSTTNRVSDIIVKEYLDKYLFENDTIDATLRDFYKKYKDTYYEQQS